MRGASAFSSLPLLSGVEGALPLVGGIIPIPAGIFAARTLKDADLIPADFAGSERRRARAF